VTTVQTDHVGEQEKHGGDTAHLIYSFPSEDLHVHSHVRDLLGSPASPSDYAREVRVYVVCLCVFVCVYI